MSAYTLVFDAVYTPKQTQLLKDAAEMGAVTVSGEEMFYGQAFAQFRYFTDLPGMFKYTCLTIVCGHPASCGGCYVVFYCAFTF